MDFHAVRYSPNSSQKSQCHEARTQIPGLDNLTVNQSYFRKENNNSFNETLQAHAEPSYPTPTVIMHTRSLDDPVILTLSSDDEDENPTSGKNRKSLGSINQDGSFQMSNSPPFSERIIDKEPIIENKSYSSLERFHCNFPGIMLHSEKLSKVSDVKFISLHCRKLRIGSFKVVPVDKATISLRGLEIVVPPYAEGEKGNVTLKFPIENIIKILGHFGKALPVFYFYITPSTAAIVRNKLKMEDKNGFYFDPCSQEQSQRRITILPEKMKTETINIIKNILNIEIKDRATKSTFNLFEELNQKEANEILVRSSPYEVDSPTKSSKTAATYETKTLLIYPPPPNKGGISITMDDYLCLKEEQFLNDVLIDFYFKWLLMSKLKEKDRDRTLMFSTFFYKRLTSKPKNGRPHSIEDDPSLTAAQKRHARVKSWTKNVDIFQKDFILIPINEHSHWFLAVICFLGLDGPVTMEGGEPASKWESDPTTPQRKSSRVRKKVEIPVIDDNEWSDRDEAEGNDYEFDDDDDDEDDNDEEEPPNKKSKAQSGKEVQVIGRNAGISDSNDMPIKQPCILIFDSLVGANRSRIVATLREYLTVEHQLRKGKQKVFSKDTMKGACPKVPQQTNYSDCGIYTLQFGEYFFEHPLMDFRLPIKTLGAWFNEEVVTRKREEVAKLIRFLMDEQKPNNGISLPPITSSKSCTEGADEEGEFKMQVDKKEDEELVETPSIPKEQINQSEEQEVAVFKTEISPTKCQSKIALKETNFPVEKKISFKIANRTPNRVIHSKLSEPNNAITLANASLKLLCDSYNNIDSDDDEIFVKEEEYKIKNSDDNVENNSVIFNPVKKGR